MRNLRCDLGRCPAQSAGMADWSLNSKLTDSGEAGNWLKVDLGKNPAIFAISFKRLRS